MLFRSTNRSPRHRMVILFLEVLVFLLIYMGLRAWMQRDLVAGAAPEIQAVNLTGSVVSLQDFQNQPVLLHFWASWCKICRFEQGAITSITDKWPVLTVAMESGTNEQVENFMRQHNLDWQTINDETGRIADRYGVAGVPTSFIIDSAGKIRFRESGYTTAAGLRLRLWLADLL